MPIVGSPRTWMTGEVVTAAHLNAEVRDQAQALRDAAPLALSTVVGNTTTETVIGVYTIPASQAAVGSAYRLRVCSNVSFLASAQLTWRARIGGVAGTLLATMGPTTASGTGQTNKESIVDLDVRCATTGASGTWFASFHEVRNWTQTGSVGEVQLSSSDGNITKDTTVSNDLVVTAQWAAASASNTLTARAFCQRYT